MYLAVPEEGGETVFPAAAAAAQAKGGGGNGAAAALSPCAQQGLAVRPAKGDMLLFYSLKPDGSEDPTSLHQSCPTLKGEKWSATLWVHVGRYQARDDAGAVVERPLPPPLPCHDANEMCAEWCVFLMADMNVCVCELMYLCVWGWGGMSDKTRSDHFCFRSQLSVSLSQPTPQGFFWRV
jgi:prolyl 4-hydroxylase